MAPTPLPGSSETQTPLADHQSLHVAPRKMNFPYTSIRNKYFFGGNSLKSSFVVALSSTFPPGEAEFIESVRNYRDQIENPQLLKQVKGFIGQEGHHSHQHKKINLALKELGYEAPHLEVEMQKIIDKRVKGLDNKTRLAITVCMEHITAILAEHALTSPEIFEGMEEPAQQLLYWHAVEEIEHKAVAFDVYMENEGDREHLHKVMKFAIKIFFWRMFTYTIKLMWWQKKLPSFKEIKGFYRYLLGKNGVITKLKQPYKLFFNENFHPWQNNSLDLIDKWEKEIYWDQSEGSVTG